jgi:hypothetical protein
VVKQTAKKAAATVKKTVKQVKKTVTTTVKSAAKTVSKTAAKVTQQIKTAVTDKGTASSPRAPPTKILDAVQTGLDIAGLVPGVGEIADGTNSLIYTLRGDKTNAALSAAACIPFAGWGAAGIKVVNKGVKALDKADDVYDAAKGARRTTILGENMRQRVIPFAEKTGARTLPWGTTPEKWTKMTPKERWKLNDSLLRSRINEGDDFRYIGSDPNRPEVDRMQFDLTGSELLRLEERGISYDIVDREEVFRTIGRY